MFTVMKLMEPTFKIAKITYIIDFLYLFNITRLKRAY